MPTAVCSCLQRAIHLRNTQGFQVKIIYTDAEFPCLSDTLLENHATRVNPAAADEHVTEIELAIRALKERSRSTISALSCRHYPKISNHL